ncbi:MAG: hypothetical protein JW940_24925 [Polyangiaceae bacterium]|nr:hypothetical protein [Polyangiaceae bacterium]
MAATCNVRWCRLGAVLAGSAARHRARGLLERVSVGCAVSSLAVVPTRALRAQSVDDGQAQRSETMAYRIDFSAGKMAVDGQGEQLELSDHVTVTVDRYRLTSEKLTLRRGPHGLEVRGEGCVALCPCEDAPMTLGFGAATVAPPTDLLIEDPTVRVGGVPVLWLPYLWLRSPERMGLLPPRLAWRGEDGLLAGAGVHLPWGTRRAAHASWGAADVAVSGYTKGGAEVVTRVGTPNSSSRVRWDYLDSSVAEIDSHGASSLGSTTGAWSVTALRGRRGRTGTPELGPAAMRYDRAELSALRVTSNSSLRVGFRGIATRAGPLDELGLVGPVGSVGTGAALGEFGTTDAYAQVWTASGPGASASSSVLQGAGLGADARPGPLCANVYARERALALTMSDTNGAAMVVGAGSEMSVPLVRRYGEQSAPAWHWVEPYARFDGAVGVDRGAAPTPLPSGSRWLSALVGVRNAIEWYRAGSASELTLSAGWLGLDARAIRALAMSMTASGDVIATDVSLDWLPDERSAGSVSRVRIGAAEGVVLDARVEGRHGRQAIAVRWFDRDVWDAPWNGWYSEPGWSAGSSLLVPWTRWLASAVAADYDLTADRSLGERGGLAYRHPCGCLALIAQAGRRLGRRGFDASLTLDLLP